MLVPYQAKLLPMAIEVAADLAPRELLPRFGRPTRSAGQSCPWCVCALGKFGGGEVGFGSDLELIFVYAGEGTTDGPTSIANSEYFAYLVQAFPRLLKARQEGIFEIDLRLRPYGKAGSLATSVDGFTSYYADEGAADPTARVTNTLEAIGRLTEGGYLSADLAADLRETYGFLRQLIDALRVVRGNAKDLTIPPDDSRELAFLAQRLKLASPADLREAIATRMARARELWTDAPPTAPIQTQPT